MAHDCVCACPVCLAGKRLVAGTDLVPGRIIEVCEDGSVLVDWGDVGDEGGRR